MLEDGLTSILLDDEIKQLVVIDGEEAQGLSRKLRSQNRPFLLTDFEEHYDLVKKHRGKIKPAEPSAKRHSIFNQLLRRRSTDGLAVVVHVLPLRLHVDSSLLQQEVHYQIERVANSQTGSFCFMEFATRFGISRTISTAVNGHFSS